MDFSVLPLCLNVPFLICSLHMLIVLNEDAVPIRFFILNLANVFARLTCFVRKAPGDVLKLLLESFHFCLELGSEHRHGVLEIVDLDIKLVQLLLRRMP